MIVMKFQQIADGGRMRKGLKKAAIILGALLLILSAGIYLYAADYYHAEDQVVSVMSMKDTITVFDNYTVLDADSEIGIIFYPGAKVEETAYLPLLEKLQTAGISCILIKMPLHLAFLNPNAADDVYQTLPTVKRWYMAGHSLGGAMASAYASKHSDTIHGVILLGAYVYGDIPDDQALVIYGSEDHILNKEKVNGGTIIVLEGGNHAQFGNYGEQKGDGKASITADEQQTQCVNAIIDFIKE